MIWLSFAFTLLKFILELPELIDWLQKIFSKWATIPEGKHKGEAKRLTGAMREALLNKHIANFTAPGAPQPLEVYFQGLEKRHPGPAQTGPLPVAEPT